jgi:hypothetical protein
VTVAYRDSNLATSTSATLTLTIPATAQEGDLLIAWRGSAYKFSAQGPAGWLERAVADGTNMQLWVGTKVCGASDPGTTFDLTLDGSSRAEGGVVAVSGTAPQLNGLVAARSSTGSSATLAVQAPASSVAVYAGAVRVASTTISLSRGTVDSQRAADTICGSVTGHEAISATEVLSQVFTAAPSGSSGYALFTGVVTEGPVPGWLLKGRPTHADDADTGG